MVNTATPSPVITLLFHTTRPHKKREYTKEITKDVTIITGCIETLSQQVLLPNIQISPTDEMIQTLTFAFFLLTTFSFLFPTRPFRYKYTAIRYDLQL